MYSSLYPFKFLLFPDPLSMPSSSVLGSSVGSVDRLSLFLLYGKCFRFFSTENDVDLCFVMYRVEDVEGSSFSPSFP